MHLRISHPVVCPPSSAALLQVRRRADRQSAADTGRCYVSDELLEQLHCIPTTPLLVLPLFEDCPRSDAASIASLCMAWPTAATTHNESTAGNNPNISRHHTNGHHISTVQYDNSVQVAVRSVSELDFGLSATSSWSSQPAASDTDTETVAQLVQLYPLRQPKEAVTFTRITLQPASSNPTLPDLATLTTHIRTQYYRRWLCMGCRIRVDTQWYNVLGSSPHNQLCMVTSRTVVLMEDAAPAPAPAATSINGSSDVSPSQAVTATSSNVNGSKSLQQLRQLLTLLVSHHHTFTTMGVSPPSGILLSGPAGVGKTWTVRTLCTDLSIQCHVVDSSTLYSSTSGDEETSIEERLREIFADAHSQAVQRQQAAVIFVDELDVLCPHRDDTDVTETFTDSHKFAATLAVLMDQLSAATPPIIVIGATNYVNSVDRLLRRAGRFSREVIITVPTTAERHTILQYYTANTTLAADVDLQQLAARCIGFVGADLQALCREATISALRRYSQHLTGAENGHRAEQATVSQAEFDTALTHTSASSQRGTFQPMSTRSVESSQTAEWEAIGGLTSVKQQLVRAVEWPVLHSATYKHLGLHPPRGILLYGPPGNAKTSLIRALAARRSASFFYADAAAIYSSYVGEAEKYLQSLFSRARANLPALVFLDELDAIVSQRGHHGSDSSGSMEGRILATLLNEMDGIEHTEGLIVAAATNRLFAIDEALLRPGRFDHHIYVPPPDAEGRRQILQSYTAKTPLADDVDLPFIASQTEYYSGADLQNLIREAGLIALREALQSKQGDAANKPQLSKRHLQLALLQTTPSMNAQLLAQYSARPAKISTFP